MKHPLFCFILFVVSCSTAQNNYQKTSKIESDSLSKYSYELFGFKNANDSAYPTIGTGFFIRKANRLFLITANHVITACNNGKIPLTRPDSLYVVIKAADSSETTILIDLRPINKETICYPFEEVPDIKVIEILAKIPSNMIINSMEKFLMERPLIPGDVEMYGFPEETTTYEGGRAIFPFQSHLYIPKKDITIIERGLMSATGKTDSINYRLFLNKPPVRAHYFGYSGSPVFFTDSLTGEKSLQGVFSAVIRDSNLPNDPMKNQQSLNLCKIKYALEQIDIILSKKPN